jgi:VanZ family protein
MRVSASPFRPDKWLGAVRTLLVSGFSVPRFLQAAFWLALALTLYLALRPPVMTMPVSDKTQHALAFAMLTVLAGLAYSTVRIPWLVGGLSAFGALIEIIQPYFHRDRDVRDWVADSIGIVVALLIVWMMRKLLFRERNPLH